MINDILPPKRPRNRDSIVSRQYAIKRPIINGRSVGLSSYKFLDPVISKKSMISAENKSAINKEFAKVSSLQTENSKFERTPLTMSDKKVLKSSKNLLKRFFAKKVILLILTMIMISITAYVGYWTWQTNNQVKSQIESQKI